MEEVFCVLAAEVFGLLTVVPGGGGCYQNIFPNYDIILVHARSKSVMSIKYPRRGIFLLKCVGPVRFRSRVAKRDILYFAVLIKQ